MKEIGPEGPVFDGTGDWGTGFDQWMKASATPPPEGPGVTIQELLAELGGPEAAEVLGRAELGRSYKLSRK